ncbi:MAG: DUF819 family protein [Tidjanibacter sp.]|nr:DUF819 family protein [Tidjanibacter sp.]MBR3931224.1 DUF819 family protein [Tidjanibacter sp.]
MIGKLLLIVFYLLAPAMVLWVCRKVKVLNKIGPVLTLYILGVIIANLHIVPEDCKAIQKTLQDVMIPLAIPMMLFGCNFKNFKAGVTVRAFIVGIVSVAVMVLGGFWLLKEQLGVSGPTIGATLSGQYSGGAGNFAAVNMMLGGQGLKGEMFALVSTCNLIVSFFYLMFLMGGGVNIARRVVHGKNFKAYNDSINAQDFVNDNPYKDFGKKKSIIQLLKVFGAAVVVAVASLLISNFFKEGTVMFDLLGGDYSLAVMILVLTTISLLLTGFKEVRTWDKSFDAGMYLIYIFCLAMAMLADLSQLDWKLGLWVLIYQTIIVFGSLALGVLLARPCKVDADSAVITSDTLVNSPICVPMIAATMKNKNAIMVGITNGLAGYAIGNYLGYLMFNLLQLL